MSYNGGKLLPIKPVSIAFLEYLRSLYAADWSSNRAGVKEKNWYRVALA